jgi:hypothetical protein
MKAHNKRYSPDRTKYIVYSNPRGAAKLLYNKGYEPPKKLRELFAAVKELSKIQGEKFQKELLSIHPEKEMLAVYLREAEQGKNQKEIKSESSLKAKSINTEKEKNYSSFCACGGACGGGAESSFCGCGGAISSFSQEKKEPITASKQVSNSSTPSADSAKEKENNTGKTFASTVGENLKKMMTIEGAVTLGVVLIVGIVIGKGLSA